ncbi:MAG: RHS repeat domain-containing protein [Terriglobia bacterium]
MPISNVYDPITNRVLGGSYDNAGNQTVVKGNTLTYGAENHVASAYDNVTHNTESYLYDGDGQRVEKTGPGGTIVYVYDAFGQLASEYSTVPVNPPCTTCYLSYDHLGSVRLVTDQNGNVVARHGFLPFGQEIPANTVGRNSQWGSKTDVEQKFTGQIRDTETGMDYFHARYFDAPLGRFNSPDPENAGADMTDPQTWNAYAYVRNNPLALTDPGGQCFWCWFAPVLDIVAVFTAQPELFGVTAAVSAGGTAATVATATSVAATAANAAAAVSSIVGRIGGSGGSPGGQASNGLPPLSDVSGMPPGMRVPSPWGIPSLGGQGCDFGDCSGNFGTNGFLNPIAVGAGEGGASIAIDIGIGTLCIGSGVCEAVAIGAGAVALGAGAYIIYKKIAKKSGKEKASDTPSWVSYHPPKRPDESCAEFAARVLSDQYGANHRKALGRGPGSEYSRIKKGCERGGL